MLRVVGIGFLSWLYDKLMSFNVGNIVDKLVGIVLENELLFKLRNWRLVRLERERRERELEKEFD